MSLATWQVYVTVVFLLAATPGPNMLHVLSRSVRFGFRRATAAMAGCGMAVVTALIASAAGLAAVLAAAPTLFEILRWVGVAYLFYLAFRAWTDRGEVGTDVEGSPSPALSSWTLFRGGFLVSITNPKLLLFAAAFLPQFIDPAAPRLPQFAILIATFAMIETFWYAAYGFGGHKLAAWLQRPAANRWFNRAVAAIFGAFGLALLLEGRR